MTMRVILGLVPEGGGAVEAGGRLNFPSEEVGGMVLMMMPGLGLQGGSEAVVAELQVCHEGEGDSVIWMKMLGSGLQGEGGVVVEECLVCHREEIGEAI